MELTMGDFKSKLPDLKEVMQISGKLFKDIKNSVGEIITDYKQKHADTEKSEAAAPATKTKPSTKKTTADKTAKDDKAEKDKE